MSSPRGYYLFGRYFSTDGTPPRIIESYKKVLENENPPDLKTFREVGGITVGIDLGTTCSCVAVWVDKLNRVEIIPNAQGNKVTPSCVAWDGTHLWVGEDAQNRIIGNPKNTAVDVKRLIGSRFSDDRVQKDIKSWPFKVIEGFGEKSMIVFEHESVEKKFSCEEISSIILKHLKESAETYLGTTVKDAVISVPAHFSDKQRQATKDAGVLAGLNVRKLINEPTSVAIAYAFDTSVDLYYHRKKHILVFDMGGGTFDVSLLDISKAGYITVKAVGGETHLGGEDFDKAMVNYCVEVFEKKEKKVVRENAIAMMKLKFACEKAKRDLSLTSQTTIEIDSLYEGIDFAIEVTRARFEDMNACYFKKCIEHVEDCLRKGNMHKKDIDDVVIVGGSTQIPKVQQMLMDFFDGKKLYNSISTDEAVAHGAAVLGANLSGYGSKQVHDLILSDVTPLSLGIAANQTNAYDMSVMIPRNTPIPTNKECCYQTALDNQQCVLIKVYEGERRKTIENVLLHSFIVDGIPAAPAGEQHIKVCFKIDTNGILNVTAQVKSTGDKKSASISSNGNLLKRLIKKTLKSIKQLS